MGGTFFVRARIKKDMFEYLRDKGVAAHIKNLTVTVGRERARGARP
jgi:hypothetical protein